MSGAGPGTIAGAFALRHDEFASRKIQTAIGVRAAAVAKRTARLADFTSGTTLGAEHVRSPLFLGAPIHRVIGASTPSPDFSRRWDAFPGAAGRAGLQRLCENSFSRLFHNVTYLFAKK
jgi:hypothetical protein